MKGNTDFLDVVYFDRLAKYEVYLNEMNSVSLLYQKQQFPTGCLVPLCIMHLWRFFQVDVAMDPPYLIDIKDAFCAAITEVFVRRFLEKPNSFLATGLLHPGVATAIHESPLVPEDVVGECYSMILRNAETLVSEEDDIPFVKSSLQIYRKKVESHEFAQKAEDGSQALPEVQLKKLMEIGAYMGINALKFWRDVQFASSGVPSKYVHLVPVAGMMLALPAGESIDEVAFSSSKGTLVDNRSAMSPVVLEQITVTRMAVQNFGWSAQQFGGFVDKLKKEAEIEEKAQKKMKKAKKNAKFSVSREPK
jgi:hypothetical protein